jgi:hypothetical protein
MSVVTAGARVFVPEDLLPCALDPGWADAQGAHCLVVRLDAGQPRSASEAATLSGWLATLPIPLIGFGAAADSGLSDVMDVLVDTRDELDRALAQVSRNPAACAVLVQVLRAVGSLGTQEALAVESLAYSTLQGGREFARWLADRRAGKAGKSSQPGGDLLLLQRDGDRLEIVLNSPRNRNALSTVLRDSLTEAFKLVAMDDALRLVEVRANGPCFSAGGDLTEFGTARDAATAHMIRMLRMPARYLAPVADRCHFHLHGACIGAGIELPAFAHRVTAAPDSFFQLPELAMGLIPGAGGCVSIPRRIGRQRTALLALTNHRIDAEQALKWGLIDDIVEQDGP